MQKNSSTFQIPSFNAPKASNSDTIVNITANNTIVANKAIKSDEIDGLKNLNIDGAINDEQGYRFKYYNELNQIAEEIEKCRSRNC
ncbi:hypothetical protein IKT18_02940 [Candidatus Saccharibacteria bacterium]|nr:hypothetical protein [Candidatus Saccharibacteria bacterium]